MRTGQARKRDSVEAEIVKVLRRLGCHVMPISGCGVPDLIVYNRRLGMHLVEIKTTKRFTTAQQRWETIGLPVHVISTTQDALALCKPIRPWP